MPFWKLYYHLVWGTKGREFLIDDEREKFVRKSMRETCEKHGALIHGIGIMPDHVHLVISMPPRIALSDMVQQLKGSSTHLINRASRRSSIEPFSWQREYGALSFGERSLDDIVSYAEDQKTHHALNTLRPLFEQLERPYPAPP